MVPGEIAQRVDAAHVGEHALADVVDVVEADVVVVRRCSARSPRSSRREMPV